MKRKTIFAGVSALLLLVVSAFAASLTGTVFGEATDLGNGTYRLVSDAEPGFGGVEYDAPVPLRFSDITTLQTLQTPEPGDTCINGSPRFQLNVDTDGDGDSDGNVFAYTQTLPGGGCPADTGDLAEAGGTGDVAGAWDTSQFVPGTQVSTYTATAAFFADNPTYRIVGIQLVIDSGYAHPDGSQIITVTPTVEVNLPQPGSARDCKGYGWRDFFRADGTPFRNQGQCIRYVNTGR